MSFKVKPPRRHRHNVRLDASVTRSGGFVLDTTVTDLSLEGCCLLGYFQPTEIVEIAIRTIGRLQAKILWVRQGRAGARFLVRRESRTPPQAATGRPLLADARGVAAIEYAFLAALIAVALVGAFSTLGAKVGEHFIDLATAAESALRSSFETEGD